MSKIVKEAPSKPKSGRLSETGPSVTLQGGLGRTVHQLLLLLVILSGTHHSMIACHTAR